MENKINLEKLKESLPAEALSQHPTKTYLTSIKAIYVTERFNEVFGVGKWTTKVEFIKDGGSGMIVVKVIFEVPEQGIYYESFGGNDNGGENNKNFDLGDAYKGATTDALTKIGSYLGIGLEVFKGKAKVGKGGNNYKNQEPKKWYNSVDKNYDTWVDLVAEGKTTPQAIIQEIENKGFSLSKVNRDKILQLNK